MGIKPGLLSHAWIKKNWQRYQKKVDGIPSDFFIEYLRNQEKILLLYCMMSKWYNNTNLYFKKSCCSWEAENNDRVETNDNAGSRE